MIVEYSVFIIIGIIAGTSAGLLGIGGGLIVVPGLVLAFHYMNIDPIVVMHMAAATSLAAMIFTATASVLSHHQRGAVVWDVFQRLLPGIVIGTIIGAIVAAFLTTNVLKYIFGIFLLLIAFKMFIAAKPKPSRDLPKGFRTPVMGFLVGAKSGLLGIGGGAVMVPFLTWCNLNLRQASGTSAACGLPIAITGTISTIVTGWHVSHLTHYNIGYVYWPAAVIIAVASVISVSFGAKLSKILPVDVIRKIFSALLLIAAINLFT